MNTKKYKWIFYLITATIVTTIGVQFYWNFKNYEENKQRVLNEIQLSLDNAIEEYYSSLAKKDFLTIVSSNSKKVNNSFVKLSSEVPLDTLIKRIKKNKKENIKPKFTFKNLEITSDENLSHEQMDSMANGVKKVITQFNRKQDSTIKTEKTNHKKAIILTQFTDVENGYNVDASGKKSDVTYFKGKKSADSLKLIKNLKPMIISFFNTSVDYKIIDSLIDNQLAQKGIKVKTSFNHLKKDTLFHQTRDSLLDSETFSVSSKSTFVKEGQAFQLLYNNTSFEALKRSSFGIFLSLILSLGIIFSLFYLIKIINQQKELATIKNDLISNITHEFKTPIATVSTAIEAIENFNVIDDKEKTKKYLAMSSLQLKKLHQMVEKLLETATLDSEQLLLKKEPVDIVEIAERLVNKHKMLANNKELTLTSNLKPIYVNVDVFHFENVISNLIDNAVKYGGNNIVINVNTVLSSTEIMIADDGEGIEKSQQEKIFDKFYRVPKGNTHNVKGFGIGLYYCKKIIEKHEGTILLSSDKKQTIFKITIPNE
jgi:two-component system phosphate regulon sensor histidine kinase PhoR